MQYQPNNSDFPFSFQKPVVDNSVSVLNLGRSHDFLCSFQWENVCVLERITEWWGIRLMNRWDRERSREREREMRNANKPHWVFQAVLFDCSNSVFSARWLLKDAHTRSIEMLRSVINTSFHSMTLSAVLSRGINECGLLSSTYELKFLFSD